jgi:hypothetical protein
MVEHVVLIKFSSNTTKEQKNELINKTYALKGIIPGIVDLQQGHNFSNRNKGYDMGLTVRFENRDALEKYMPHPKHQEVLAFLKEIGLEDLIIVDFDVK